jgi:hypothetical protein
MCTEQLCHAQCTSCSFLARTVPQLYKRLVQLNLACPAIPAMTACSTEVSDRFILT